MSDRLWPDEGASDLESLFAPLFDCVEADEGLTAGFGLFREVQDAGKRRDGEETMRVVGWVEMPSFPRVHPRLLLQACAPAELEKVERQLRRPDPRTGVKPVVVEVLVGPPLELDREREILDGLGLTVEEVRERCEALPGGSR
jgi:hypothetical protein